MSSGSEFTDGVATMTGEDDEVSESFLLAFLGIGGVVEEIFELSGLFMGRRLVKLRGSLFVIARLLAVLRDVRI
jgi:hypothetical protein